MPDPATERFIAAACAPLADNAELKLMAEAELRDALDHGRLDPDRAAAVAAQLERRRTRSIARRLLYAATALVCLIAQPAAWCDYARWQTACWALFGMDDPINHHIQVPFQLGPPLPLPEIFGKFTPADEALLFGDRAKTRDRYRQLSEQSPSDAALLAEHAKITASWGGLPPDFLKTAAELDPDNGWFPYFAAGVVARNAVEETRSKTGKKYKITDPAGFAEAIRLVEEAATKPQFNSYRDEILLRRQMILPPGDDVLGRLFAHEFVSSGGATDVYTHRFLGRALAAKIEELRIAGGADGFLRAAEAWDVLSRRVVEEGASNSLNAAWAGVTVSVPTPAEWAAAANALGLTREAEYYESRSLALKDRSARLKNSGEGWGHLLAHGSFLETRYQPQSEEPPTFSDADLKPGRMADHALLERLFCYSGGVILLCLAGLAAVNRFSQGRQARLLSGSLLRVLDTRDYAWIIGAGMALPAALYLITEHVELLAGLRWSVWKSSPGQVMRGVAALSLMIALPPELAGWRLARRLTGREGARWWRWLRRLILGAAIAVWAYGCIAADHGSDAYSPAVIHAALTIASCCAAYPLLGGLVIWFRHGRSGALPGLTLCRAVIPAYISGVLLTAAASLLWRSEEKAWIALENFRKIEPGIPATSRFDHETGRRISAELLRALDAKP